MTTVAGVDLSYSRTAVALMGSDHPTTPKFYAITTRSLLATADAAAKLARIHTIRTQLSMCILGVDLVVLEGPSMAAKGRAVVDMSGLWWLAYEALIGQAPAVVVVPPTSLKRWATGSGSADKFAVGQAIAKRFPDAELRSADEADALTLAAMGAQHAGYLPWTPTQLQRAAHRRVAWPRIGVAA